MSNYRLNGILILKEGNGHINIQQLMKNQSNQKTMNNLRLENKAKLHRYPARRWGHTAIIYNKKLIIYGGKTGRVKEPIYRINCQTYECQVIQDSNLPKARESHSCSLIKDKMVIWGGCQNQEVLNDCWQYVLSDQKGFWESVAQFPKIKPRQSHASTVLNQKFILIYGGSGMNQQIFDDFYIFDVQNSIWFHLKNVEGSLQTKIGCTMQVIGDTIYLFGGELSNENQYSNQIYKIKLSNYNFKDRQNPPIVKIQKIQIVGIKPPCRSGHASVSYLNRYIIILGGQGPMSGKSNLPTLLNDLWCFDTQANKWIELSYQNIHLYKPRSNFTANIYKNRIFIFGGLISLQGFKSSDELFVLWLDSIPQVQPVVCNICKFNFIPTPQIPIQSQPPVIKPNQNYFQLSVKTFFKISNLIKHPFEAIGLIVDSFHQLSCQKLQGYFHPHQYLLFKGQSLHFQKEEFMKLVSCLQYSIPRQEPNSYLKSALKDHIIEEKINCFGYNIKLGSAKLGQAIFIGNLRNGQLQICMINESMINFISIDQSTNDNIQLDIIKRQINKYIEYEKLFGNNQSLFIILITGIQKFSQILSTDQIFNTHGNSINSYYSDGVSICTKKSDLIDYLQLLFLKKPKMVMTFNQKIVYFRSLQEQLSNSQKYQTKYTHNFIDIKFCVPRDHTIGVRYYLNNRMIGKFVSQQQTIDGYVHLPKNCGLNITNTRLQNSRNIDLIVKQLVDEFRKQSKKRKSSFAIIDLEND